MGAHTKVSSEISMTAESPQGSQDREMAIIKRILKGDQDEYRHLVEAYEGMIYSLIMRQVGDSHIARDLSQDTFVKAYVNLKSFRGEARFSTWLTRIALNVASSYFSSRSYRDRMSSISFDPALHAKSSEDSEERASEHEIRLIQACIGELKPKFREVLVLCALEQRSYEEAAEILGIPYGTVCSRMATAFSDLRKKMGRFQR